MTELESGMEEQQEAGAQSLPQAGVMVSTGFDVQQQVVAIQLEAPPGVVELNAAGHAVLRLILPAEQAVALAQRMVADAMLAGFDKPIAFEVGKASEA